jgi:hypothetical protein
VRYPGIVTGLCGSRARVTTNDRWGISVQRMMNPVPIVIALEVSEFSFKVVNIPEEDVIEVFTTNCSYQSLLG